MTPLGSRHVDAGAGGAPTHELVSIEDVGAYAAFLASPGAANVTGEVHYIDGGYRLLQKAGLVDDQNRFLVRQRFQRVIASRHQ